VAFTLSRVRTIVYRRGLQNRLSLQNSWR
jgi:hypothetical protein